MLKYISVAVPLAAAIDVPKAGDFSTCFCYPDTNQWVFAATDLIKVLNAESLDAPSVVDVMNNLRCPDQPAMGDLFMSTGERDMGQFPELLQSAHEEDSRIKMGQMCLSGHLAQFTLCSQKMILYNNIEAAFSYFNMMVEILNSGIVDGCLDKSIFLLERQQLGEYVNRMMSSTNEIVSMLQSGEDVKSFMRYSQELQRHRGDTPARDRPCLPIKDPGCFPNTPRISALAESCSACCDPLAKGDLQCFDNEWTYERCCQVDFQGLDCQEIYDPATDSTTFHCDHEEFLAAQRAESTLQKKNEELESRRQDLTFAEHSMQSAQQDLGAKEAHFQDLRNEQDRLAGLVSEQEAKVRELDAGSEKRIKELEAEREVAGVDAKEKLDVLAEIEGRMSRICESSEQAEAAKTKANENLEAAYQAMAAAETAAKEALQRLPQMPEAKTAGVAGTSDGPMMFIKNFISDFMAKIFGGPVAAGASGAQCSAGDTSCGDLVSAHQSAMDQHEQADAAHAETSRLSDAASDHAESEMKKCGKLRNEYDAESAAAKPWTGHFDNLSKQIDEAKGGLESAKQSLASLNEQLRVAQQDRAAFQDGFEGQAQEIEMLQQQYGAVEGQFVEAQQGIEMAEHQYNGAMEALQRFQMQESVNHLAMRSMQEYLAAR